MVSVDDHRKQIGVVSATFLIFNRMIGTGIFATPSDIYVQCGSLGMALSVWVMGAVISAAGLMVYLEWGSAIPKNGGEKNYLEFFYTKPRFLFTCMYASYILLLGWAASNSVVFGEYILTAAGVEVDRWNQRVLGVACCTFSFLVHAIHIKFGLRLQNFLGLFKFFVIALIIGIGAIALTGNLVEPTHAFEGPLFQGTKLSVYGIVSSLYNVMWSFLGYSNINYALSETKDPSRTLKIAGPVALVCVSLAYLLSNIAYFAVVPKQTIADSGRILAASFFRIVFGAAGEKALSVIVALSALGNVMSGIFTQGRIVQELGMQNLLPFSSFFASNKPFDSPFNGLLHCWLISLVIIIVPPPGDAYNFILNLITYPLSSVNALVAFALICIYRNKDGKYSSWAPPIRAGLLPTVFFMLASIYLVVAPFVPPDDPSQNIYDHLPYYSHSLVSFGFFGCGALYWLVVYHILPSRHGYRYEVVESVDENGWERARLVKVNNGPEGQALLAESGVQSL